MDAMQFPNCSPAGHPECLHPFKATPCFAFSFCDVSVSSISWQLSDRRVTVSLSARDPHPNPVKDILLLYTIKLFWAREKKVRRSESFAYCVP